MAALVAGALLAGSRGAGAGEVAGRPRLLVLTDISSLTTGVREPDDGQSMVRLMLYANDLDIEGLIASSNMRHGQIVRPELIREVVSAYAQVQPNLLLHSDAYPEAPYLMERVKAGQPVAGPKVPIFDSIGDGKDTEASRWIISVVDKPDPRPVWIAIWGGAADLAQALWNVRHTRSAAQVEDFIARLRVHSIYDQDSTGAWIKENFPALFFITRHHGVRGMYRGGDTELVSARWVETHVRTGHGALGALDPNYDGGDIWSRTLGRVRGIKEGDTPSFLGLIPNGLNDPQQPSWGAWGGRFEKVDGSDSRYTDARDEFPGAATDLDPRMAAVYRWRPAFQADFQARLDWCVQAYAQANHPPVARIRGEQERTVSPGTEVILDAGASSVPDGDSLAYEWSFYPEPGSYSGLLDIWNSTSPVARFIAPDVTSPQTIHIILTLRDDGQPALARYQRCVITVAPRGG